MVALAMAVGGIVLGWSQVEFLVWTLNPGQGIWISPFLTAFGVLVLISNSFPAITVWLILGTWRRKGRYRGVRLGLSAGLILFCIGRVVWLWLSRDNERALIGALADLAAGTLLVGAAWLLCGRRRMHVTADDPSLTEAPLRDPNRAHS